MGAEESVPAQSAGAAPAMSDQLSSAQSKQLKSADKERTRRMSLIQKTPAFASDVSDKSFTKAELEKMQKYLNTTRAALYKRMESLGANKGAGYIKEFQKLGKLGANRSSIHGATEKNAVLNRYINILPFDHTRVCVKPNEFNGNNDYINASYMDGYKFPNKYIAAQGPIPPTFPAFWQSVWEHNCNVIIMVTNEVEGGKLKCHRYWPKSGELMEAGSMTVSHSFQEVKPTYIKRSLTLQNNETFETRDIIQFAFTAWPDHGIPSSTQDLLQYRAAIRSVQKKDCPVMIHCSAGVGRTGTYIAVDRFLESVLDMDKDVSVQKIIENLRDSRRYMVQSQLQYQFVHGACLTGVTQALMKVDRELRFMTMDVEEKHDAQLQELQEDIVEYEQEQKKGIDARYDADSEKDARLQSADLAKKVPVKARKGSFMQYADKSSDHWKDRGNVDLDIGSKGYKIEEAAALDARVDALVTASTTTYANAASSWAGGKDSYDVKTSLTPLDSRVMSLAASEQAYSVKGESLRTAKEEEARQACMELAARLESLQQFVVSDSQRWQSRGDGLRGAAADHSADGLRSHTVQQLGDLSSRLNMLQQDQLEKQKPPVGYDTSKFKAEVEKERKTQEEKYQKFLAEQKKLEEAAAAQQAKDDASAAAAARKAAEEAEATRRSNAKSKMKKKAAAPPAEAVAVVPKGRRQSKQDLAAEASNAEARKTQEDEEKATEDKQRRRRKSKEDAQAKAAKFLSKMKK